MDAYVDFYGVPASAWRWSQTGFIFHLSRRWPKYTFIYFIPSGLCVVTSWVSFLIDPQVEQWSPWIRYISVLSGCSWSYFSTCHSFSLAHNSLSINHQLQSDSSRWHHSPYCMDNHSIPLHCCSHNRLCLTSCLHKIHRLQGRVEDLNSQEYRSDIYHCISITLCNMLQSILAGVCAPLIQNTSTVILVLTFLSVAKFLLSILPIYMW